MGKQIIKKLDFEGTGYVMSTHEPKDMWFWLNKESIFLINNGYGHTVEGCIELGDIFLDDYIEDLDCYL